jgi:hypothetical protein
MSDAARAYDEGIASRIAEEMPLTLDLDPYRLRLLELGSAIMERRDPLALEAIARRTLAREWDEELGAWIRDSLEDMRTEYEQRVAYLESAIAELESRGGSSHVAKKVVVCLAGKLIFDARLGVDDLDELEERLSDGAIQAFDAVIQATAAGGRVLGVPDDEARRVFVGAVRSATTEPEGDRRFAIRRAARLLAVDGRRAQVVEWAGGFVEAMGPRLPELTAAVAEAVDTAGEKRPADDPLWLGAVRGVLIEYQARALTSGQGRFAVAFS